MLGCVYQEIYKLQTIKYHVMEMLFKGFLFSFYIYNFDDEANHIIFIIIIIITLKTIFSHVK